ncbi:hypothetical protein [Streptomyces sp. 8N706]|uniref:hypothetical protein n=1 Tax=Streptomyces sp. 8N706 TaxID=3457416 RepID=UPI003FD3959B
MLYPRERWIDEQFALGPQHDVLRDAIGTELDQLQGALMVRASPGPEGTGRCT